MVFERRLLGKEWITRAFRARCASRYVATPSGFRKMYCWPRTLKFADWRMPFAKWPTVPPRSAYKYQFQNQLSHRGHKEHRASKTRENRQDAKDAKTCGRSAEVEKWRSGEVAIVV